MHFRICSAIHVHRSSVCICLATDLQETLDDVIIPHVDIDANRRPHVVKYLIAKALGKWLDRRQSLLARAIPVDIRTAQRMLKMGFKLASRLGRWCPVKVCCVGK